MGIGSMSGGVIVLGQQSLVHVEALQGGEWWEVWLLERSWLTGVVLVLAGVFAWFLLAPRTKKRIGAAVAAVLMALGVVVAGLGHAVETDREHLRGLTARFVADFVDGDTAALESVISDEVMLLTSGAAVNADRGLLIGASRATPVSEYSFTDLGATTEGERIGKTRFGVRTTHEGLAGVVTGGTVVPSAWELDWEKGNDGVWRITTFGCLHVYHRSPGDEWVTWARRVAR